MSADTTESRLLATDTYSAVSAIVDSVQCRKALLELSLELGTESNGKLRRALEADEKHIISLLVSIFNSRRAEAEVLSLQANSAQTFMDVVQDALDHGSLSMPDDARKARRIIHKLSEICGLLPTALYIYGVRDREAWPSFGGGYGDIYRATYDGKPVALKYMRHFNLRGSGAHRQRLRFLREALVWRELQHPHILPLLGIDDKSFPLSLCMVSPWMENSTVVQYLKDRGRDGEVVNRLLFEIAQGLAYLHSRNIVHGDLRGANILIGPGPMHQACLADFGLSVFSHESSSMRTSTRAGCVYWMAPELIDPERFGITGKFVRTTASDVYAFGCVCFELYTGRPPFARFPEPTALLKVVSGKRAHRPRSIDAEPEISDSLWDRIVTYWAEDPSARPTLPTVVKDMVWPPDISQDQIHLPIPLPLPPGPSSPESDASSIFSFLVTDRDPELELNADVLRALQDCQAALSNTKRLTKALQMTTGSSSLPRALHALRDKCIAWQERIAMQVPWAANLALAQRGIAQGLHLHLVATNDRLMAALRLFDEIGPTDWNPRMDAAAVSQASLLFVDGVVSQTPDGQERRKPIFGIGRLPSFSSLRNVTLLPKKRRRNTSASEQSASTLVEDPKSTNKSHNRSRAKTFDPTSSFLQLN
ncbi:Kinase-like protein [Mycena kentingensis (nom. inval.)]|nr:Kinase-like protein [Mycena kentingensis (nom. inval.)]